MSFSWDIPPFWFLAALLAEWLLHGLIPGPQLWSFPWTLGSVPLIAAGLVLLIWSARPFRAVGTGIRPFTPATVLVRRGPFRFSRNPMYLAMLTMLVGAAVALGTTAPWLVPPVFATTLQTRFIRREEAFLLERFGGRYRELCQHVRRWL